jgi:hypothetical protein
MLERVSEAAGVHLHPHALRRTFEDIASFCGVDGDQRRQLLNHLASDVHGQSYANNPDPLHLLPAVTAVANWITAQAVEYEETIANEYQQRFGTPINPPLDYGQVMMDWGTCISLARKALQDNSPIDWSLHLAPLPEGAVS